MPTKSSIPVHRVLISYLRKGFEVLDDKAQNELFRFLQESQHKDGGFKDRAEFPDLYYSLFGCWMAQATDQKDLLQNLRQYIASQQETELGIVERMALILIRSDLNKQSKKYSIIRLFKMLRRDGKNLNLSYQFFLFTLVIDTVGKSQNLFYFFARIVLFFYHPKNDLPCSLFAALVFARKKVGLSVRKQQQQLLDFAIENGGFKAFHHVQNSDMLSTGVALFSLVETDADLRLLKPATLDFIQNNYSTGAFLSGDGDHTRDLEYTFYGLLALGSLVNDKDGI